MQRRNFVKKLGGGAFLLGAGSFPMELLGKNSKHDIRRLVILHTNDVHSRIDPFPMDGSRNQGRAGVAARARMISDIRAEGHPVLLLDAGDYFQGTPYFNMFGGELEIKLMSELKYDAATIGNHDFDGGIDGLAKQLKHADFPLLIANYDFSNTVMHDKTQPYKVFTYNGVKVGVFGIGIELKGLVPKSLYKETVFHDPIPVAQKMADKLRNEEKCDYVICLSHIGFKYKNEPDVISDVSLSKMTSNIDLIIGGHTHTFLKSPAMEKNKEGKPVMINQVGFAGILLGRIDLFFENARPGRCETCENLMVS